MIFDLDTLITVTVKSTFFSGKFSERTNVELKKKKCSRQLVGLPGEIKIFSNLYRIKD